MKNTSRDITTEGLKDIDIEIQHYDTLKISQTNRGFLILMILLLYFPMTATLVLAGFPLIKALITFLVYIPILYFFHKRVYWAYIALPVIFYIDILLTVAMGLLGYKLLVFLVFFTPFFYRAFIIEMEHRKIVTDSSYISAYKHDDAVDAFQETETLQNTEGGDIKSRLTRGLLILIILMVIYYQDQEQFNEAYTTIGGSPGLILLTAIFFVVWIGWVSLKKRKSGSLVVGLFLAVLVTYVGIMYFVKKDHEEFMSELNIKEEVYKRELEQKIKKDLGLIPWYTEDKTLWIEDLDVKEGYRMLVPPEMKIVDAQEEVDAYDGKNNNNAFVLRVTQEEIPEQFATVEEYREHLMSSSTQHTQNAEVVNFKNTITLKQNTALSATSSYTSFYAFSTNEDSYHRIIIFEPYYSRDRKLFDEILRTFEPIKQ
jgi:hypothetical protein